MAERTHQTTTKHFCGTKKYGKTTFWLRGSGDLYYPTCMLLSRCALQLLHVCTFSVTCMYMCVTCMYMCVTCMYMCVTCMYMCVTCMYMCVTCMYMCVTCMYMCVTLCTCVLHVCTCVLHVCTCVLHVCTCVLHVCTCVLHVCTCVLHVCTCVLHVCTCVLHVCTCVPYSCVHCKNKDTCTCMYTSFLIMLPGSTGLCLKQIAIHNPAVEKLTFQNASLIAWPGTSSVYYWTFDRSVGVHVCVCELKNFIVVLYFCGIAAVVQRVCQHTHVRVYLFSLSYSHNTSFDQIEHACTGNTCIQFIVYCEDVLWRPFCEDVLGCPLCTVKMC